MKGFQIVWPALCLSLKRLFTGPVVGNIFDSLYATTKLVVYLYYAIANEWWGNSLVFHLIT